MIGYLFFMVILAIILALWEIQIEGKDGWASKAPCWRIEKSWVMKIMGGRPLTGYHVFMTIFIIVIVHLPVVFILWSWQLELLLLGFYVGMVTLEDFLWFVFNPAFGIKKFKKGEIWWHPNWLGPVPVDYYFMVATSVVLIYFGSAAL